MIERSDIPVPAFERSRPRATPHGGAAGDAPLLHPGHLDTLWLQVAGTICNIRCSHCFISCAPDNHAFGFLDAGDAARRLDEAAALGVREVYVTGGEPFLHPDLVAIVTRALAEFPTTVLTNGMVIKERHARPLAAAAAASPYSLEIRLSLDGPDAPSHDALRGAGSFDRTMRGLDLLLAHGFLPIVTAVRTWEDAEEDAVVGRLVGLLRARGYARPRLKVLPAFRIGAEVARAGGYRRDERVTPESLEGFDLETLVCSSARVVTDRGIWVCPILLDAPEGFLGDDLAAAAAAPFRLDHAACWTCRSHGAICANPGGALPERAAP